MAFIDEAKFFVKGGNGGKGCVSFRREKFVPKGGPNGGDGGRGGSVYIIADRQRKSLIDFKYRSHFKAENGQSGSGKDKHGRGGKDCIIKVPVGSLIKDPETDHVFADLTEPGVMFLAAGGGRGGFGNTHFASSTNRTPRKCTDGQEGEERWLRIELKLIADVGLIGLPNAGKSTLLSRLSAANPKIAPYPFTTLEPQLGVLQFQRGDSCIIADIPGLIKGAHKGVGLGYKFLRHIERTIILLHILDASKEDEEVVEDYLVLENELTAYKNELLDRIRVIVLNKIDLLDNNRLISLESKLHSFGLKVICISAATGDGIDTMKEMLADMLEKARVRENK